MFTKSSLQNGDVCVQRGGTTEIYLNDSAVGPVFLTYGRNGYYGWNSIDEKRDDLTSKFQDWPQFDIVKVFRPKDPAAYNFLKTIYEGQPNERWVCVFDRINETNNMEA